jgi:hypothetical protein
MKQILIVKILRKILILSLLTGGLMVILDDRFTQLSQANSLYCDFQAQMTSFVGCDTNFLDTNERFDSRVAFCTAYAQEECDSNSPNYQTCLTNTGNTCQNERTIAYNNNYNSFSDCANGLDGIMYNPVYCTPEPDPCPDVINRVQQCRLMFPVTTYSAEETAAQRSCIEALPHVLASKGGYTCLGTNYQPE